MIAVFKWEGVRITLTIVLGFDDGKYKIALEDNRVFKVKDKLVCSLIKYLF